MNFAMRRIGLAAVFILLGVYGYVTLRGPHGIPGVVSKLREIRQYEEGNADIAREIELKRERIRKLQESRAEQGLEIRKKLKMLQQDEIEFILPNAPKVDAAPAHVESATP